MAVGTDLINSVKGALSGTVPKAVLMVRKPNAQAGASAGADKRLNLLSELSAKAQNELAGVSSAELSAIADRNDYYSMPVQYNPASLSFRSAAGSFVSQGPGEDGANQYTQTIISGNTQLSVKLIFEDINVKDAFMWEKFRLSAADVKDTATGIMKARQGGYSVQAQVEGIVSLLTNIRTRQVIFCWEKMIFFGELIRVNAKYTMFNMSGNPIRAELDLAIRQEEIGERGQAADLQYWDKAFDNLFGSSMENTVIDDQAALQKVGNLINFNF